MRISQVIQITVKTILISVIVGFFVIICALVHQDASKPRSWRQLQCVFVSAAETGSDRNNSKFVVVRVVAEGDDWFIESNDSRFITLTRGDSITVSFLEAEYDRPSGLAFYNANLERVW